MPKKETYEVFVPGRLCVLGEHTDWIAGYRSINRRIARGLTLVCSTSEGLYARCSTYKPGLLRYAYYVRNYDEDDVALQKQIAYQNNDSNSTKLKQQILGEEHHELIAELNLTKLKELANGGGFFAYVAGTLAACMEQQYAEIGYNSEFYKYGIEIVNYKTTLPMKKGLSSSAAVCVLVVKSFNVLYNNNSDSKRNDLGGCMEEKRGTSIETLEDDEDNAVKDGGVAKLKAESGGDVITGSSSSTTTDRVDCESAGHGHAGSNNSKSGDIVLVTVEHLEEVEYTGDAASQGDGKGNGTVAGESGSGGGVGSVANAVEGRSVVDMNHPHRSRSNSRSNPNCVADSQQDGKECEGNWNQAMIMELAYRGECYTPSQCGRMDQCVVMGRDKVGLMEFTGDLHPPPSAISTAPTSPIPVTPATANTGSSSSTLPHGSGAYTTHSSSSPSPSIIPSIITLPSPRLPADIRVLYNHAPLYFVVGDVMGHKHTVTILRELNDCFPYPRDSKQVKQ